MLLSYVEIECEAMHSVYLKTFDFSSSIYWLYHSQDYGSYSDPFSDTFSNDESIMEIIMSDDAPWGDNHHH